MITTPAERPRRDVTPASILSLHDAGYRAVLERLGEARCRVLDVGCGEGFESVRLAGPGRLVVAVDYSEAAAREARAGEPAGGMAVACCDASALSLSDGAFDWAVSSHLIEHFSDPRPHVAEMARVLAPGGTACFLTPNAPADFENPFHLRLFEPGELAGELSHAFGVVEVLGIDASARVKADLAARRAKARRLLALDVFDLRHKMPRSWYVAVYTRLLPLAYRALGYGERRAGRSCGVSAVSEADWFVTPGVDASTPVLFAVCRRPVRRP